MLLKRWCCCSYLTRDTERWPCPCMVLYHRFTYYSQRYGRHLANTVEWLVLASTATRAVSTILVTNLLQNLVKEKYAIIWNLIKHLNINYNADKHVFVWLYEYKRAIINHRPWLYEYKRAIINHRPCCNVFISWPMTRPTTATVQWTSPRTTRHQWRFYVGARGAQAPQILPRPPKYFQG